MSLPVRTVYATILGAYSCLTMLTGEPPKPAPRVDAFGDPLPQDVLARIGTTRWWHGSPLFFLSDCRDDDEMLTVGIDGSVRLWNVVDGRTIRQFGTVEPNTEHVWAAAISADRRVLAIAESNATIRLWSVNDGREIRHFSTSLEDEISGLEFSPDGKLLAIKTYVQALTLFHVRTGKEVRKICSPTNTRLELRRGLAFAPDGKSVYSATMRQENNQSRVYAIKCFDSETALVLQTIQFKPGEDLQVMALSPDGKTLAWGSSLGLRIWDTETQQPLHEIEVADCGGSLDGISFSADRRTLVTHGSGEMDQMICFRDVNSGKEIRRFTATETFGEPVISANGRFLAACTSGNTIRLWDMTTEKDRLPMLHHCPVFNAGLSANGDTAITLGMGNQVRVWDVATSKMRSSFCLGNDTSYMAVSGDGQWVLANNSQGTAKVWNVAGGEAGKEWKISEGTDIDALSVTFDGQVAAARSCDAGIRLFDVATGKPRNLIDSTYNPEAYRPGPMTFSRDGAFVASVLHGSFIQPVPGRQVQIAGKIDVWEVAGGARVRSINLGSRCVQAMAFTPNGHAILTSDGTPEYDNVIAVWEVASGQLRAAIPTRTEMGISVLAITPDGQRVLGSGMDSIVRVFDLRSGRESRQFLGHQGGVSWLALAADGKSFITGGNDTTALVFDLRQLPTLETPRSDRLETTRLDTLWNDLASSDAKQAHAAILALLRSPQQAVQLIRDRLKVTPPANRDHVLKLVANLSAEEFSARERATEELARLSGSAENVLNEVLNGPLELEAKLRIRKVLWCLSPSHSLPTDQLQAVRSLEILETLGGEVARQTVESLAKHPIPSRLTHAVQGTLKRMRP